MNYIHTHIYISVTIMELVSTRAESWSQEYVVCICSYTEDIQLV